MCTYKGIGSSLLALAVLSCSSATPPPQDATTNQVVAAPSPKAAEGPLEPVPAPQDLFLVGRLKSPEQSLEQIASWIHLPIPWREGLAREFPSLAKYVDATAPVDLAMTLDPDALGSPTPLMGISIGLSDTSGTVDGLRAEGKQVEKQGAGTHFVKLDDDVRCIIGRANGQAPGRIVCSEKRKALDVLGPYMMRTLSTEELATEDLLLRFDAEPLRRRFGKKAHMLKVGVPIFLREASLGNARFDAALSDSAHALADEIILLVQEFERATLTASLNEAEEVAEAHFTVALSGQKSWTSKTMRQNADVAKPAPEIFWKLPKDATQAAYEVGPANVERNKPLLEALEELALGAAEHYGIKTPTVERLLAAYVDLINIDGARVYASGPEPTIGEAKQTSFKNAVGYHVLGVENDQGRLKKLIEETVQLYNDAKLRKLAEKELDEKLKHLPAIKKGSTRGLPNGTTLYELTLTPQKLEKLMAGSDAPKPQEPITLQLAVVSEGERTWAVFAADPVLLKSTLARVLQGAEGEALASRLGLESFKNQPASFAGFVTLSEYARSMGAVNDVEGGAKLSPRDVLLAMPAQGKTPITYRATYTATGPSMELTFDMPRAALEDLTAAVVSLAAQSGAF